MFGGAEPPSPSRSEATTLTEERSDERVLQSKRGSEGGRLARGGDAVSLRQQTRSRLRRSGVGKSGHATAWRLQGRQPGPRAFQRGLQAEPQMPTPWK